MTKGENSFFEMKKAEGVPALDIFHSRQADGKEYSGKTE